MPWNDSHQLVLSRHYLRLHSCHGVCLYQWVQTIQLYEKRNACNRQTSFYTSHKQIKLYVINVQLFFCLCVPRAKDISCTFTTYTDSVAAWQDCFTKSHIFSITPILLFGDYVVFICSVVCKLCNNNFNVQNVVTLIFMCISSSTRWEHISFFSVGLTVTSCTLFSDLDMTETSKYYIYVCRNPTHI